MQWTLALSFITIMAILFLKAWPEQALALLAELKRQLRLHVIRQSGQNEFKRFLPSFKHTAQQAGFNPDLIEDVLRDYEGVIIEKLGHKQADEILGEPSSLEHYH